MNSVKLGGQHRWAQLDRPALGFWLGLIVLWLASLPVRDLISPDEGRYASLALQMLQSGDWVTPRLNGILYFEKPPLQYWAGAASMALFGVNEFAARFWPGFTGLLAVAVVGWTAHKLWELGEIAALVLAGSLWIVGNSHFLTLDMGLTACLSAVLCAVMYAMHTEVTPQQQRWSLRLAWVAMAGAVLAKGLVGLVIPGASLLLYSLVCRDWRLWRVMPWLSGLALLLALTVPWFWLVSARNPGFAEFFFIHEHFQRYLTTEHRRTGAIWYFLPILFAGFLPWSAWLPKLVREGWQHNPPAGWQPNRFLLIWAGFVLVFFSVSGSKLPSYILPMFPALALLLAQTLARGNPARWRPYLWLPIGLWALVLLYVPLAGRFASGNTPLEVVQHFANYLGAAALLFLLAAASAWRYLGQGALRPALRCLALGSVLTVVVGSAGHDEYGNLKSSKALLAQVGQHTSLAVPFFTVRTYEQTLPFYLGRPVTQVEYQDEFAFGQQAEPGVALSMPQFLTRWQSLPAVLVLLDESTYRELQQQGLPMRVVYRDHRRMVVAKP
ncbi:glycosyltransferase family 39 protein [Chitinibacter tainanensis]|uniref:glycosyltransferase family 39 protein n=1 Tax=Chitinibacter tainanensis TaxID=230667 RepID=UPI0004044141|nr:glycosyltransferase family 39 protein [Chitinibacter tainanensis]